MKNSILSLSIIMFLSACNGSSPDSTDNAVTIPSNTIVSSEENIHVNQSVDLILFYPKAQISDIQWQQTSGVQVTILSTASKVIAFTPMSAGEYSFEVSFKVDGGTRQVLSHSFIVNEVPSQLSARLGHAVIEGNKVSFQASMNEEISKQSLTWQQLSGPNITFSEQDTNGQSAVFFDAPFVNEDTILTFSVNGSASSNTVSDIVAILVEDSQSINDNAYFDKPLAKTFAYNATSPYANNLVNCVYSNQLSSSCTLATLPLIAQESTTPSIDNIMDRVVVSHQWMGDRFKDFLQQYDDNNDFKNLLRATTAIVISYDVRPSFYWAATGAIYLDANNFWLTPDERDTINQTPDYRSTFGNDLQFIMPWRYVKDNDYASTYASQDERMSRTSADGLYRLTSLMYHELSHANDFFPKNEWFTHSQNMRVLDAALNTNFESDSLSVAFPLNGNEMRALAQVSFAGASANNTQKAYTQDDIKQFFSPEQANDFYNYSSLREDYAMLFEALMMQSRYNVIRDVAITNAPTGDNVTASDYIVTWGQRGRIGEPNIKPRVAYVAARVLPEFDSALAINSLPSPIAMRPGDDWLENLTISPSEALPSSYKLKKMSNNNVVAPLPIQQMPYFQKKLPSH